MNTDEHGWTRIRFNHRECRKHKDVTRIALNDEYSNVREAVKEALKKMTVEGAE